MSIPSVPPIPGIPTPTLLTYADLVTVNMDETNDVNIADTGDYGHRVQVTLGKTLFNLYFRWHRDVGQDRPHAKLSTSDIVESTFKTVLIESLNSSYMDIDGVTGGLHFSTANLSLNTDPRLRKNGLVSANDIPMAFVLYRLYGNSAFQTKNFVFNLQDAHDMLTSETVADAIIASFKQHEAAALDKMFRDLLAQDPKRFFTETGVSDPNIFESATDLAGNGSWKLVENDIIEIKTKLIFHSNITKRGVAGREHLLSDINEAENQQKIIVPDDYFYIRLQLKIVDDGTIVDPTNLIYSDSTRTVVTGYTGSITGELIIPEGTTSIAAAAFKNQVGLTSVLFPQSLMSIGAEAFMNTGLVEVYLPNVTSIGASSFKNCTALETVLAPNLTTIGANAFEGCTALESFNGSSTIAPVGARAIGDIPTIIDTQDVVNLTNITSLGAYTFSGCESIQEVTIPNTFTSIAEGAFSGCANITSVSIPTSITSIGASAFAGSGITSITLHSGLLALGPSIFSNCPALTSVTILGPITTLPSGLFLNSSNLTSVTLPSSLTTIASEAFKNTRITTLSLPNVTTIGAGAFASNPALTSIIAPSVQTVAADAFTGNTSATNIPADPSSLTFSDGTNTIVTGYTGSMGVVILPSSVTSIADSAFLNNSNVIGIAVNGTLQSIGASAFKGSGLKSITIPSTVTSIGTYAFQSCTALTSVTLPSATPTMGTYIFSGCTGLTSVSIPAGMTSIPSYFFNACSNITSITTHDGITSIGSYAFSGCSKLASFTVPSNLTTLSSYTFNGCVTLTSITLPLTLLNYQQGAFAGCAGLTSITFPSTTMSIGDQALLNCTGLTSVTLPNKSGIFGTGVLKGCTGLASFTIPSNMASIPNGFFEGTGLTSITVPSTVTTLGTGVFKGCASLTSATVNAAITALPDSTFLNCTALTTITLASSIIEIAAQALRNIRIVSFTSTLIITIGASAFADNPALSSASIPNLLNLDPTAFNNTPALPVKPSNLVAFSPSQVSGLSVWLDANDASTLTLGTNNAVSSWLDKSGTNRHGTTFTGTVQLQNNSFNGKPSVYFSYGTVRSGLTAFSNTNSSTVVTLFQVFRYPVQDSTLAFVRIGGTSIMMKGQNAGSSVTRLTTVSRQWEFAPTIPGAANTNMLVFTQQNTTKDIITMNAGTPSQSNTTRDSGYNINGAWYLGLPSTNGEFYGNVAEVLIYVGAISTAQQQSIEGYLAWKWGLQGQLPTTHPYYTNNPSVLGIPPISYVADFPSTIGSVTQGYPLWNGTSYEYGITLTGVANMWSTRSGAPSLYRTIPSSSNWVFESEIQIGPSGIPQNFVGALVVYSDVNGANIPIHVGWTYWGGNKPTFEFTGAGSVFGSGTSDYGQSFPSAPTLGTSYVGIRLIKNGNVFTGQWKFPLTAAWSNFNASFTWTAPPTNIRVGLLSKSGSSSTYVSKFRNVTLTYT